MNTAGTNSERAKHYNRRVVLEIIRLHGPVSRTEIAKRANLSTQAASNIAADLHSDGLINQLGRRKTARGQPPIEWSLNPDGGYTIGFEIHPFGLIGLLVNLVGKVCASVNYEINDPGPKNSLKQMGRAIAELVSLSRIDKTLLSGIGLVMPGPFDDTPLTARGPTTLQGWAGYPIREKLRELSGVAVFIENDASAAATAQSLYGAARGLRNFIYLHIGAGFGAGLVLNASPFRGTWNNAGEIGHMIVEPDGLPCWCGNNGCLEQYVSLHGAQMFLEPGSSSTAGSLRAVLNRLESDQNARKRWIDHCAPRLVRALINIENMLDPETILLGGIISEGILDDLIKAVGDLPNSISKRKNRQQIRLKKAQTGPDVPATGAAALPLFQSLNTDIATISRQ